MRKPKSRSKQLAAQKRAAKRNRRNIRVRNERNQRRLKFEEARKKTARGMKEFLEKVDEAQRNFEESNNLKEG